MALRVTERDGGVLVDVLVQPRARRAEVGPVAPDAGGDRLKVAVTAPPVEGAANAAVVEAIARALGVPRRAVSIVRGETGRRKTVRIEGVTAAAVMAVAGVTGMGK
jgi:uncharacterized protein (TIGR00251 family)